MCPYRLRDLGESCHSRPTITTRRAPGARVSTLELQKLHLDPLLPYPPWHGTAVRRPRPQPPPFVRDPASAIGCSSLSAPTRASAHPAPASVSRLARGGTWAGLSSDHAGRSSGADVTAPPPKPEPVGVSAASGPSASREPRSGGSDPRSTPGAPPPARHGCAPRATRSDGGRARVREGQADAPREGNPGRWATPNPNSERPVCPRFRVGRGRPGPAQLPEGRRGGVATRAPSPRASSPRESFGHASWRPPCGGMGTVP